MKTAEFLGVDAAIVANRADGAMLVIESGQTRRESAIAALERLLQADAKPLGAALNKVPQKPNGYSCYYYYSHYYEGEGEGKRRKSRRRKRAEKQGWKLPRLLG